MTIHGQNNGRLEETSVPALLVDLHRERFTGLLNLAAGTLKRSIRLDEGIPIAFETTNPGRSLATRLVESGDLSEGDRARVEAWVTRQGGCELAALLEFEFTEPQCLLSLVRKVTWEELEECFAWSRGAWCTDIDRSQEPALRLLHADPYPRIQRLLARVWSVDRILKDLEPHYGSFISSNLQFTALSARLERDAATSIFFSRLDGTHTLHELLGAACVSPLAVASAWLLERAGCLRLRDLPAASTCSSTSRAPEIEIVRSPSEDDVSCIAEAPAKEFLPSSGVAVSTVAQDLYDEIRKRVENLPQQDHYEVLEVSHDDVPAKIRTAYLRAAKRYHPDVVGRVDLPAAQQSAVVLFARIAEAWETLGNPSKRREYDCAQQESTEDNEAERIAQAETFYRKGEILLRMGDFSGAEKFLAPAAELWPGEAAYLCALGWALYKKTPSEPTRALQALGAALQTRPDDAVTLFRIGLVQRSLGDSKNAARSIARARELDPETGGADSR